MPDLQRRLQLHQSLRYQIPGTLCLLSESAAPHLKELPLGYHYDKIADGHSLVASLSTFDKLIRNRAEIIECPRADLSCPSRSASGLLRARTSPLRFSTSMRFPSATVPHVSEETVRPYVAVPANDIRDVPTSPGTAESTTGISQEPVPLYSEASTTGTKRKRVDSTRTLPAETDGPSDCRQPDYLSKADKQKLGWLPMRETHLWHHGMKGSYGGLLPSDCYLPLQYQHLFLWRMIRPGTNNLLFQPLFSAVWSPGVAVFIFVPFNDHSTGDCEILLVHGLEWKHRWWVDKKKLLTALRTLNTIRDAQGVHPRRYSWMISVMYPGRLLTYASISNEGVQLVTMPFSPGGDLGKHIPPETELSANAMRAGKPSYFCKVPEKIKHQSAWEVTGGHRGIAVSFEQLFEMYEEPTYE